jgi:ubiquinone biosynthesis protein
VSSFFSRVRKGSLHLGRYGEILSVLIRYGFGDFVSMLNIDRYTAVTNRFIPRRNKPSNIHHITRWERIRLAIEELGPTFIKFGQFMSNRPDILPADLIVELEKLQDNVKPFDVEEVKATILSELNLPLSALFADFTETPLASGSIAQVHRARLADGHEVAVKVCRPRIRQTIETDVEILANLVTIIERHDEKWRVFHLGQLVEEFRVMISKELDFAVEAGHMERFRQNFKNTAGIHIPEVFPDLSTRKVLTSEFIDGIKVSDLEGIRAAGLDARQIAGQGATLILRQIFEHGFFHADPHPGNILVTADGTLCFLDFGAVGFIPPSLRHQLGVILFSVVNKDPQRIVKSLSQLSRQPIRNSERLEYEIMEMIEEYGLLQLQEIQAGEIMRRFTNLIIMHDLKVVPGFFPLLKALLTFEAVGCRLDPEFNLTTHAGPFVKKLIREFPRLRYMPFEIYFTLLDCAALIKDLPFEFKEILRSVKNGELRIQFEHRGLGPLIAKADQLVNRIVFAIVLAALIVGSSIVILSGIPPKVYDVPLIGVAGFLLAGMIGFGLLFDMMRKKRM